ncbi:MAG: AbrB/MazE/SpoVT family DNA-binding domain-containing protein [Anaerolineae bacterium]
MAIAPAKGWIVIPHDLRERYGLKPGVCVALVDYGGVLSIVPAMDNPVEEAAGLLKGKRPLTQALLEEQTSPSRRF